MAPKKGLLEGFAKEVGVSIRDFFSRVPEQAAADLRQGGIPAVERAGMPYSVVSQYGYNSLAEHLRIDSDLMVRYGEYSDMDNYPEITSCLDIFADDATTPDMERGKSVWVTAENQDIATGLDTMLHKTILVEDDLWPLARTVAKMGNAFGELLVSQQGLVGINFMPPETVRRVEDPRGNLMGFVQDVRGEFNLTMDDFYKLAKQRKVQNQASMVTVFEDWEVVHWRLRGKHLRSVYGHGVIDGARYIWKRLVLLEDAILIYKLTRAPSRYAFYVDVGQMDAERGLAYVNRVKNNFKKQKFVSPSTGKLDMRHNPMSHDDDFFIPVVNGKESTRIEVLQGPDYSETDTVEYHRDKLVAALKTPRAYLGIGADAETKGALSSLDIRFARTVMRLQREIRNGLKKACRVHLVASGANPDDHDYDVHLSVPSAILELAKLEVMSAKADLATRFGEFVGTKWILTKLFGYTDDEAVAIMAEKDDDLLRKAKIEAQVQAMIQSAMQPQQPTEQPPGDQQYQGDQEEPPPPPDQGRYDSNESRSRTKTVVDRILARPTFDWRRDFEGDKMAEKRADARLRGWQDSGWKNDKAFKKRLGEMAGLLSDIKQALQPV